MVVHECRSREQTEKTSGAGQSVSKMKLSREGILARAEGQIQKPMFKRWKQEVELPKENRRNLESFRVQRLRGESWKEEEGIRE